MFNLTIDTNACIYRLAMLTFFFREHWFNVYTGQGGPVITNKLFPECFRLSWISTDRKFSDTLGK